MHGLLVDINNPTIFNPFTLTGFLSWVGVIAFVLLIRFFMNYEGYSSLKYSEKPIHRFLRNTNFITDKFDSDLKYLLFLFFTYFFYILLLLVGILSSTYSIYESKTLNVEEKELVDSFVKEYGDKLELSVVNIEESKTVNYSLNTDSSNSYIVTFLYNKKSYDLEIPSNKINVDVDKEDSKILLYTYKDLNKDEQYKLIQYVKDDLGYVLVNSVSIGKDILKNSFN